MIFEDTIESALNLFGLQIKKAQSKQDLSGQLSTGLDDDGSSIVQSSASGAFGTYLDQDGQVKTEIEAIKKYREISLFAEVDVALQEIVNEAIPQEQDSKMLSIDLEDIDGLSDSLKKNISEEFKNVLTLIQYDDYAADLFKRWYIDGRMPIQIIVDKANLKAGIQKLIVLDALNVKKVKEVLTKVTSEGVTVIDKIDEYYLYSEVATTSKNKNTTGSVGVRISPDALIYCTSGITDNNSGMILSYLNKAIRPINQLRMLEDATVVYFIARAPERRVFYIDVGNLPKLKAEQYLKDIMNRYRNKMVYDARTGDVKNDKKYMSMLEDFWMPRRDGNKGTEITTLQGAQNITGYLDSLAWFKEKVYESLNIPKSRLQSENGFSMGKSQEISRDEVKFQKFIDKLRSRFGQIIIDALKTQLILKGICNSEEWDDIKSYIKLNFQKDNFFSELKNQEILQSRLLMIQQTDDYLQKYFSKNWIQKNVLMMSEEEIEDENKQMATEKDDETAQPNWKIRGQFQADQQSEMMQQQADAQGGMFGQPQPGQPQSQNDTSPQNQPDAEYDQGNFQQKNQ